MAILSVRRNGVSHFYHHDGLGSTVQLTDANQNVTDSYVYRAFGEEQAVTGTTPNPLRFVGNQNYHTDVQSGLKLLGVRHYDPRHGRFMGYDPGRWESNLYDYTENDPINAADPVGLISKKCAKLIADAKISAAAVAWDTNCVDENCKEIITDELTYCCIAPNNWVAVKTPKCGWDKKPSAENNCKGKMYDHKEEVGGKDGKGGRCKHLRVQLMNLKKSGCFNSAPPKIRNKVMCPLVQLYDEKCILNQCAITPQEDMIIMKPLYGSCGIEGSP